MRAANDVVRFALELCSLAALAYWGSQTGPTGLNIVLAIAAPLAAAAVWGAFVAPKARRHPRDPWRLGLELLVFGSGIAGLAATGRTGLATALGATAAAHLALTFVLGSAAPGRTARERPSRPLPLAVLGRYSAGPAGGRAGGGGTSSAGGATVANTPPRSA